MGRTPIRRLGGLLGVGIVFAVLVLLGFPPASQAYVDGARDASKAPSISMLSTVSGLRGSTLTITGKQFGARRGRSCVQFGASKCAAYVKWSATRIVCRVPSKAAFGKLKLRVITTRGASRSVSFTVTHPTVLGNRSKVLTGSQAARLTSVSADQSTLTFSGALPAGVSVGKFLIIAPCQAAPEGLLREVIAVDSSGGSTIVTTAPASLDEAVQSLDVVWQHPVSLAELGNPTYLRTGVHLIAPRTRAATRSLNLSWSVDCNLDGVKATGTIGLKQTIDFNLRVSWFKLKSARFTTTSTQTSSLTLSSSTGWSKTKTWTLATYAMQPIVIQAGPVPVVIVPTLQVYVGAKGSVEAAITTGIHEQASVTAGAAYENGSVHAITNRSMTAGFNPPSISAGASLKGFGAAKLATRIYSLAGPYAALEGYGKISADPFANPWWNLHAGLDAKLGFDITILGHSFGDWSLEKNLIDWELGHSTTAPPSPPASPTPSPTPTPTPSDTPVVGPEFPVCTADGNQWYPAISGDIVVWEDGRSGPSDIYGRSGGGAEFPICTEYGSQSQPAISGNTVVWRDDRNGNSDIYGYDLVSHTEFPICTDPAHQGDPAISGDIVVWDDFRNGNFDIYGYNLVTHTEFPICTETHEQGWPAISGNTVVWHDERNGDFDVYGYDLVDKTEFPICTATGEQGNCAISGTTVVWMDGRTGGGRAIYGYDLTTHTEFPICTATGDRQWPAISGNIVVWGDCRSGYYDIYGYDLAGHTEFPICTAELDQMLPAIDGKTIAWMDYRSGYYDIYAARLDP